ncbi:Sterol uptake control protein [Lachnellula suecica]|uniref:Sterol uptake control protein n=1 Tax=Lachnellula suecica TaxID=602035 RepID=A0A8T9CGY4_9HELO|nr:Sterol uptake control protein [Lachnellula suecica]
MASASANTTSKILLPTGIWETSAKASRVATDDATIGDDGAGDPSVKAESAALPANKRGRKGHAKSRRGCFNCKRARIKCKENRPSCDYCAHRNLICKWPGIHVQLGTPTFTPAPPPSPRSSSIPKVVFFEGPKINTQDFKLFHHFIESAYPHQPIQSDSVWKHEIPSISSNHDYLLHGMLALAAFDLAEHYPDSSKQLYYSAISHRVQAIKSLKAAISSGLNTFEQGNAMLATCSTLIFQSAFIDDGLTEFMAFLRGTVAVGIQMGMSRMHILFENLFGDKDVEIKDSAMKLAALVNPVLVGAALRSLEKIRPLCKSGVEIEVYGLLLSTARSLVTSSRDGYMELRKVYAAFSYTMQQTNFQEFISPANKVCQLLQAHFLALQLTMTPVAKTEPEGHRKGTTKDGVTARWFASLHRDIPEELKEYYEWTLWVEYEVKQNRVFNGVVKTEMEEVFQ